MLQLYNTYLSSYVASFKPCVGDEVDYVVKVLSIHYNTTFCRNDARVIAHFRKIIELLPASERDALLDILQNDLVNL